MRRPKKQATDVASASLFSRAAWQPSGKQAQRPVTDQLVHLCIDDASPVLVGSNFIPGTGSRSSEKGPNANPSAPWVPSQRYRDYGLSCYIPCGCEQLRCAFAVTGDVRARWEMQRRKLDGLGLASVYTLLILEQTSGRPDELRSSVLPRVQGEAPDHRTQAGVMWRRSPQRFWEGRAPH